MEGLRISLRTKGVTVTTVCPGFVQTAMTPMDSATPFIMTAEAAAARIARVIAKRKGGVVCVSAADGLVMSALIARLPDALVARFMADDAGKPAAPEIAEACRGARPMIDLALKMMLDEKARFAATVLGVGFAAGLVLVQVGLFFGLLDNASITIDKLGADLWITARNTPNVDFGNPFPEGYVQRVRSIPGVARADNLIVWYAIVTLPSGAKETVVYYGLENFPAWSFPWDIESGDPADLRRGRYVMLDLSAEHRFGAFQVGDYREFQGRRLKIIGRTRRGSLIHDQPDRVSRLSAGAVAFAGRALRANDVSPWSGSSPAPIRRPFGARFAAGCPTTMFTRAASGPRGRAVTGSRAPGSG